MKRFYEVSNPDELASKCKELWDLPLDACIGPVNTNCPENVTVIKLVMVCESPSIDEVIQGLPTVGDTGKKIYNRWQEAHGSPGLTHFDLRDYYHCLATNGIYITNLVRCQADFNGAKRQEKNRRVRLAWDYNACYLEEELAKIHSVSPGARVLFTVGTAFCKEVADARRFVTVLGMPCRETLHPSRFPKCLSVHYYNPENWE